MKDRRGVPLSTDSPENRAAYETALRALNTYRGDPVSIDRYRVGPRLSGVTGPDAAAGSEQVSGVRLWGWGAARDDEQGGGGQAGADDRVHCEAYREIRVPGPKLA